MVPKLIGFLIWLGCRLQSEPSSKTQIDRSVQFFRSTLIAIVAQNKFQHWLGKLHLNVACKFRSNIVMQGLPFCVDCWHENSAKLLSKQCHEILFPTLFHHKVLNADSFIYLVEESFRDRISHILHFARNRWNKVKWMPRVGTTIAL